jgi:hypothetical protein
MVISLCFKRRGLSDSLYMPTQRPFYIYMHSPAEMKEPDTDELWCELKFEVWRIIHEMIVSTFVSIVSSNV